MKTLNQKNLKINPSIQGAVCVIDGGEGIRNSLYLLLSTLGVMVDGFL